MEQQRKLASDDAAAADHHINGVAAELVGEHALVAVTQKDQIGSLAGLDGASVGESE